MDATITDKLRALSVSAGAEPLTLTQRRAIDLYKRGFNVVPLPYGSKQPFEKAPLARLFNSRLHFCGDDARAVCRHKAPVFASLFERVNLAVMCGKTSGNLLAVDCDSQAAYADMGKRLDALALPYWTFTSHRGGCYLLRVAEGEAANVAKDEGKFADVELWGNSHYVLMPPSLHPEGKFYAWRGGDPLYNLPTEYATLPAVSVEALRWLGAVLLQDAKRGESKPLDLFGLSAQYAALSRRNRDTLAHGVQEGKRNKRLTALSYDMAAHFDREDVEADFLLAAERCKPPYPRRDALAILKSAYRSPRKPAKETSGEDARITRLRAFVAAFDWRATFGRKARTRRAVFAACVERSAVEGETFRASVRELAEAANRKRQYVGVCLHDLQRAGLLKLARSWRESASGANVYAFGDVVKPYCKNVPLTITCNSNGKFLQYQKIPNSDAWRDVFSTRGLGAVAGDVLLALQAKPYQSIYAIAKDTGAAYNSVKNAVKRLVGVGLAIHSPAEGLYYAEAASEADLLAASIKLETNGRAELQRIRHNIDREVYVTRRFWDAIQRQRAKTAARVTPHSGQNGTKRSSKPKQAEVTKCNAKK